jgi:hypothetical protein
VGNRPKSIYKEVIEMESMKKSVLAVLLLILLVACAGGRKAEKPQPTDFRTGTQGLVMRFVPNLPPPRIFDREPFNAMLELENKGTSPLGAPTDRIYLSGFDNSIITGINTYGEQIPLMEGRGPFMPQGAVDTVSFRGTVQSLSAKRIDKYQPTILATACYNYETIASAQVCIDPNPYAPTSVQKVCIPSTVSTGSQGAPIAVTGVEVDPSPGRTRFTIRISNVGGGDVFRFGPQYMDSCSPYNPGLSFDEIDFLQVAEVGVSDVSIRETCKPLDNSQHIRLTNGQATLFCEYTSMREQSPYLTPLNIILRYGYRQSIAKPLEIRPVA